MSLATKVLVGMALGVLAGLFFGEKAAVLKIGGDAFIQLLQMTVLPFVSVSLIAGVGRLTQEQAISLARKCGALLLVFWGIGFVTVMLAVMAYPSWQSASFFSASLAEESKPTNFLALYIPANPFYSLANNIVPAVVVFSIAVGIGLIGIERKGEFLAALDVFSDALTRVTGMVLRLSPIGVFAITAAAAGTMNVEDLGRLQVFLVTYAVASLVLAFWVLPAIATSSTSLSYRDVVRTIQDALVTAFATGSLLIILPVLTERGVPLLQKATPEKSEAASAVEILVPITFTFPTMGLILTLGFVPFAAWYVGSPLTPHQYPAFIASAAVSAFGGGYVAVPFLLNLFRLPADLFQLFVTVTVFTGRFATLLAAMHIWVLTLLGASALTGTLAIRGLRLIRVAFTSVLLLVLTLGGARLFFTYGLDVKYSKGQEFMEMDLTDATQRLLSQAGTPAAAPSLPAPAAPAGSRMAEIARRGTLRVGYFDDSLPFVFENRAHQLVGHDVEMGQLLALELGVRPEFVRIPRDESAERLDRGECDLLMSGMVVTPQRALEMTLIPYLDQTLGFVVEDPRREEFSSWETLRAEARLRIAVPRVVYYRSFLASRLPKAELGEITSAEEFFKTRQQPFDALLLPAETGSAWTLVDPQYSVVVPTPDPVKVPTAYAVPRAAPELAAFVGTWVDLKRKDGTLARLYDHWILGKGAASREPRWSVIRNVLHWEE
jgi:Na+/H+-dicarboxylate symporter/ABC-type amino acid transport substrate-binding protein